MDSSTVNVGSPQSVTTEARRHGSAGHSPTHQLATLTSHHSHVVLTVVHAHVEEHHAVALHRQTSHRVTLASEGTGTVVKQRQVTHRDGVSVDVLVLGEESTEAEVTTATGDEGGGVGVLDVSTRSHLFFHGVVELLHTTETGEEDDVHLSSVGSSIESVAHHGLELGSRQLAVRVNVRDLLEHTGTERDGLAVLVSLVDNTVSVAVVLAVPHGKLALLLPTQHVLVLLEIVPQVGRATTHVELEVHNAVRHVALVAVRLTQQRNLVAHLGRSHPVALGATASGEGVSSEQLNSKDASEVRARHRSARVRRHELDGVHETTGTGGGVTRDAQLRVVAVTKFDNVVLVEPTLGKGNRTTNHRNVSVGNSSNRLVDAAHHRVIILDVVDVLNVSETFGEEGERETLVFTSAQVSNHRGQNVRLREQSIGQRVLVGHTFAVEGILVQTQLLEVISHFSLWLKV